MGAAAVAKRSGFDRIITFDMGGTSSDVALIDGQPTTTNEADVAGFPCACRCLIFTPLARAVDRWRALMQVALCAWDLNRQALIRGQSVMAKASVPPY